MKRDCNSTTGIFLWILAVMVLSACTRRDINDYQNVMDDIQGIWIGHDYNGGIHRHIKLIISDNTFKGWLQISDNEVEPEWTVLPGEEGNLSLSSVLNNPDRNGKYRKINFYMRGRCCGDNSLTARMLSSLVDYYDGTGLSVTGQKPMARKP